MGYTVIASNEKEGRVMAELLGDANGCTVWDGPVPKKGSFVDIGNGLRMSTPEYFFFRKANQLPAEKALMLGMELCGKYATKLTSPYVGDGYEYLRQARTSKEKLWKYLRQVQDTEEGKRALDILGDVAEGSASPMSTYLYLLTILAEEKDYVKHNKIDVSAVYDTEKGLAPRPYGSYLAYDVFWPEANVALVYSYNDMDQRDFEALECGGDVLVFNVTANDVKDGLVSAKISEAVHHAAARAKKDRPTHAIRRKDIWAVMEKPSYKSMALTWRDIHSHMA